jgi:hypothetical protein
MTMGRWAGAGSCWQEAVLGLPHGARIVRGCSEKPLEMSKAPRKATNDTDWSRRVLLEENDSAGGFVRDEAVIERRRRAWGEVCSAQVPLALAFDNFDRCALKPARNCNRPFNRRIKRVEWSSAPVKGWIETSARGSRAPAQLPRTQPYFHQFLDHVL